MNGGVRKGLNSLSQRIIGANTIVQGALPNILKQTPEAFFKETLDVIEENAKVNYIVYGKKNRIHAIQNLIIL